MIKKITFFLASITIICLLFWSSIWVGSFKVGKTGIFVDKGKSLDRIAFDEHGRVWGCYQAWDSTTNPAGFNIEVIESNKLIATYELFNVASDATCNNIVFDKRGSVWVGFEDGIKIFDGTAWTILTNKSLNIDQITTLSVDGLGNIWVGSYGGISIFDGKAWKSYKKDNSPLEGEFVNIIVFDYDDRAWLGTNHSIYVFDGKDWETYNNPDVRDITSISFDNDGAAWIGHDNGVTKFDGKDWVHFTSNNSGLASDIEVENIIVDNLDRVWVFQAHDNSYISVYDDNDWLYYLDASDYGYRSAEISKDGRIWLSHYVNGGFDVLTSKEIKLVSKSTGTLLMFLISGGIGFVFVLSICMLLSYALNSWKGIGLGFILGASIAIYSIIQTYSQYDIELMLNRRSFFEGTSIDNLTNCSFAKSWHRTLKN